MWVRLEKSLKIDRMNVDFSFLNIHIHICSEQNMNIDYILVNGFALQSTSREHISTAVNTIQNKQKSN